MRKVTFLSGLLLIALASAARPSQGVAGSSGSSGEATAARSLHGLQQDFVDLRFGMFIHFNMPTFLDADWPDPQTPSGRVHILRFPTVWGDAVRVSFSGQPTPVSIAELGVYNEKK